MPNLLQMDTAAANQLANSMRHSIDVMRSQYETMSLQISAVVGVTWISMAATEFEKEFHSEDEQFRRMTAHLQLLAMRLIVEVAQWEQMQRSE